LGLVYEQLQVANARYRLPEVGRIISADTIVPEPERPQRPASPLARATLFDYNPTAL
jgi:hypothetical protein